jgi:hypothetical protein
MPPIVRKDCAGNLAPLVELVSALADVQQSKPPARTNSPTIMSMALSFMFSDPQME